MVLLALLPEQSLGYAVGGEQALGEGAGCGKPGQGIGIQGREGFREVEALGLRDAPQLGDGGAAAEGVVEAEPLAPRDGVPAGGSRRFVVGRNAAHIGTSAGAGFAQAGWLHDVVAKLPQNALALVVVGGDKIALGGFEGRMSQ